MPRFPLGAHTWSNYEFFPSFVLGFHGCDESLGEAILRGETPHLERSANDYDWLGEGIYFWEGNVARAIQFAEERAAGGRNSAGDVTAPFVLGAIINLGRCLDLADSSAVAQVRRSYEVLHQFTASEKRALPTNGKELKARRLDCLVFNTLHKIREQSGEAPYDTVRGLFWEDEAIYPGAGISEGNHIQICVREVASILGYFRPIPLTN